MIGTEDFSVKNSLQQKAQEDNSCPLAPLLSLGRFTSRPEPAAIFAGVQEGLDHLSREEVVVELDQLIDPEVIAVEVVVRWIVRIPAQVAEVLHLDKRARKFPADKRGVLGHA